MWLAVERIVEEVGSVQVRSEQRGGEGGDDRQVGGVPEVGGGGAGLAVGGVVTGGVLRG